MSILHGNVRELEGRITNCILGVKGLSFVTMGHVSHRLSLLFQLKDLAKGVSVTRKSLRTKPPLPSPSLPHLACVAVGFVCASQFSMHE